MTHQYFSALIINYHSYFDTWFVFLSSDESESRFWMVCKTYWPLWLFICCFICNTKNTNFVYVAIMNSASLFFSKIFGDISPWKILSKLDFNSSKKSISFLCIWNPLLLFTVIIYTHNAAYICLFGNSEWYITFLLEDFSRFFVLEDFVEVGFLKKSKFFFICKNYPLFPVEIFP